MIIHQPDVCVSLATGHLLQNTESPQKHINTGNVCKKPKKTVLVRLKSHSGLLKNKYNQKPN